MDIKIEESQGQGYDIIMLATARWDSPYSSTAFSLAKALASHTRVFLIDNPFTLKYFLANRKKPEMVMRKNALLYGKDIFYHRQEWHPNLTIVTPKLIVPLNWMPAGKLYNLVSGYNDRIVSQAINSTIKKYNVKNYVFINSFNCFFGRAFNLVRKPILSIYQNIDNISESEYFKKHGVWLEAEAMRSYDATIVTSSELKKKSSMYSQNVHLVPNAADVRLFSDAATRLLEVPSEFSDLEPGRKVIVYIGAICQRIDYPLLIALAKKHNDKLLMMVGPIRAQHHIESGLAALPNVRFIGRKNLDELPAYLQHSHCCIIPFLCNELTKSIYPLKVNEYLSAGKPVVTTNFSEDIMSFSDVVYTSTNHENFIANVEKAISEDDADRKHARLQASASNNWENRAVQIRGIIDHELDHRSNLRLAV